MTNPFKDIDAFQTACDQEPSESNYDMYIGLIDEEFSELQEAIIAEDRKEQLDALIDILVVTIGAIRAGGMDGEGAWKEVMQTNFAKIDPDTGKVRKRDDGKVLKPEGWKPPNLESFLYTQMTKTRKVFLVLALIIFGWAFSLDNKVKFESSKTEYYEIETSVLPPAPKK